MSAADKTTRRKAAALEYDPTRSDAPRVTAKGEGLLAEKIIQVALEHGVPVREDSDLVQILMKLELNEPIPPHLYRVVAEILVFLYKVNEEWKARKGL